MVYRINVIHSAQKQILALSRNTQLEIVQVIDGLMNEPRPHGCRKLRNMELWRIRQGHYRVIYCIDEKDASITIIKVAARREDTYHGL